MLYIILMLMFLICFLTLFIYIFFANVLLLAACMSTKSLQLCSTLCDPMDFSLLGSFSPWDSPGKNTGVGCHCRLQGIFPTQGSNPRLLYLLLWFADGLLATSATWEAFTWCSFYIYFIYLLIFNTPFFIFIFPFYIYFKLGKWC